MTIETFLAIEFLALAAIGFTYVKWPKKKDKHKSK